MKNNNYYAGHEFQWMRQFLDAIPKWYSRSVAFSIASAIHHQCRYKKSLVFSLPHSLLNDFGIQYRSLPIYLKIFQENGLLKFSNSIGCSFKVELLLSPQFYNKETTTNKQNKHEYTGRPSINNEVGSSKLQGNLVLSNEVDLAVNNEVKNPTKQGMKRPRKHRGKEPRRKRTRRIKKWVKS